jgi:hypothetical protein
MHICRKSVGLFEKYFCKETELNPILYAVWIIYCVSVFVIASHHECWFDETQAWLLARDAGPLELISYLPYEGSPPLWHLILMIPAKLGMPFVSIRVISLSIMCFGAYVILLKSPFPIGIRVFVPFNYYFLYQYSVVARSYCLILPLIVLVALFYDDRRKRPLRYIVSVVMFSWVSSHTAVVAGGLVVSDVLSCIFHYRPRESVEKNYVIKLILVFSVNTLLLAYMCWPANNINLRTPVQFSLSRFLAHNKLMLTQAVYDDIWLTLLILFIIIKHAFDAKRGLPVTITFMFLFMLYGFVYTNLWHAGVIVCLIVFVLWISSSSRIEWSKSLSLSVLAISLLQFHDTCSTIRNDWKYSYSGAGEAARKIKTILGDSHSLDAYGFASHAVLAYFNYGEICFSNAPQPWHEFYTWTDRSISTALPQVIHPSSDVVLITYYNMGFMVLPAEQITPAGYKNIGVFPGWTFWKNGVYENYCYYVFKKV